jgi:hypothetical protein
MLDITSDEAELVKFAINLSSANAEDVDKDGEGDDEMTWRELLLFIVPWDPACRKELKKCLNTERVEREKMQENAKRLHHWLQGVVTS